MDLGALTENLIALKETVNSIVINEDKNVGDFELSVETVSYTHLTLPTKA